MALCEIDEPPDWIRKLWTLSPRRKLKKKKKKKRRWRREVRACPWLKNTPPTEFLNNDWFKSYQKTRNFYFSRFPNLLLQLLLILQTQFSVYDFYAKSLRKALLLCGHWGALADSKGRSRRGWSRILPHLCYLASLSPLLLRCRPQGAD